jgi:hypothetical protein
MQYFLGRILIARGGPGADAAHCFKTALETLGRFVFRSDAEEQLARFTRKP